VYENLSSLWPTDISCVGGALLILHSTWNARLRWIDYTPLSVSIAKISPEKIPRSKKRTAPLTRGTVSELLEIPVTPLVADTKKTIWTK